MEIYRCDHCGNIIVYLTDRKVPIHCCGEKMRLLKADVTDGAKEKHIPVFTHKDGQIVVEIGSVPHPMLEEHWIEWIMIETDQGVSVKWLKPGAKPEAAFALAKGESLKNVYEYCNIHGLWMKKA
ncbi:desulfoferrodoxin family protein [Massiliimalia timonensis]